MRSPASGNIEHRADEETYHVMEKPVGLDVERQPVIAIAPRRCGHLARVIVVRWCRAANRKRMELVSAEYTPCGSIKGVAVDRSGHVPLPMTAKGRKGRIVGADQIRIATGRCAVASVELGTHLMRRRDPHIVGKQGIHRASQREWRPFVWHLHADHLSAGVYARISPAGPLGHNPLSAQTGEHALQFTLHGSPLRLDLPARERGSVVVQHELHGAHRHEAKLSPATPQVKQTARRTTD